MHHIDGLFRSNPERQRRIAGFSLIELMITVVVLGVVMGIAIPSFRYVHNSGRITAPSNELVASIQLARAEAMRRNARVVMCSSANNTSCSNSSSWAGWIVFADTDRDGTVDAGETIIKAFTVAAPATVTSSSNVTQGKLVFRSDGFPRNTGGTLLQAKIGVCAAVTMPAENARDVTIGQGGSQIFVVRRNGGGACAAPSNT
ncbi:GspH/FimT family pseudopilin [Lysobacter sp. GCM10012299]|uniref:GspH/FimT family pseudopilin n=1 Tax=Lysobacter sp. GCM10012299 TaxID=3317333 RepID=UPI003613F399